MACRMRWSGPIPGKKPKKVGWLLRLNARRLPCCTNSPPENWFRTMNGPALVLFWIEMLGESFHVLRKSGGRPNEVVHSTSVWNVCSYSTRRTPPGAVLSRITNSRRCPDETSFTSTEFDQ